MEWIKHLDAVFVFQDVVGYTSSFRLRECIWSSVYCAARFLCNYAVLCFGCVQTPCKTNWMSVHASADGLRIVHPRQRMNHWNKLFEMCTRTFPHKIVISVQINTSAIITEGWRSVLPPHSILQEMQQWSATGPISNWSTCLHQWLLQQLAIFKLWKNFGTHMFSAVFVTIRIMHRQKKPVECF